jgi:hypothetical protein
MSATATNPDAALPRVTRRVARLFRIERTGRLERCPAPMAQRLICRRGALIQALIAADYQRRADAAAQSPALAEALGDLASEVGRCRPATERRLEELAAELRLRGGAAAPTGLRSGVSGRLLGTS